MPRTIQRIRFEGQTPPPYAYLLQVAKDAADYQHWNFRFLNLSYNFRSETALPRRAARFVLSRVRSLLSKAHPLAKPAMSA
jgi:hypothetical protein